MGYLTVFQLLRRCFLLDAAAHPPPPEILAGTRRTLVERGAGGSAAGPTAAGERAEKISENFEKNKTE